MFHFQQFDVADEDCAMKVGTDGVLLGGWAEPIPPLPNSHTPLHYLDIGTGSGLVALMLAQRFPHAQIIGIDIDEPSARQAEANFAASPWSKRLEAKHISLQEFTNLDSSTPSFSLIVSNPPYFRDALKCPDEGRKQARHTDSLSYDELLRCAAQLLTQDGVLALILPAEAERDILTQAATSGLYPLRITRVHTSPIKPAKRILIDLTLNFKLSTLNFTRNDVTLDALNEPLLRDFYQRDFRNR